MKGPSAHPLLHAWGLRFALPLLLVLLGAGSGCRRSDPGAIPVLMYHGVLPPPCPSVWTVSTHEFEGQMADLRAAGYTTILPRDLVLARRGLRRLPRKPLILTFDDGLLNNMLHAEPVLRRHGFRAICYLIIDQVADAPDARRHYRGEPCLTWPEVRAMQRRGTFAFGIHSRSHSADIQRQIRELDGLRAIFRRHTGRTTTDYCYPHGQAPDSLRNAVAAAGFRTAMICEDTMLADYRTCDPLRIPRVSIYGGDHHFRLTPPTDAGGGRFTAEASNAGTPLPVRAVLRDLASGAVWHYNPPLRLGPAPQLWQWTVPGETRDRPALRAEIWEQNGLFRYAVDAPSPADDLAPEP